MRSVDRAGAPAGDRTAAALMLDAVAIPVHREGWPFLAGAALVAIVGAFFSSWLAAAAVAGAAGFAFFFRDPARTTPTRQGLVVAPADGRIILVDQAPPPAALGLPERPRPRIAIFLSVFDVHINRAPVDGVVGRSVHRPGRFRNAADPAANAENEQRATLFEAGQGVDVVVVQIAGMIARRIVAWAKPGQTLRAGERFGMIRFGSRVDLYLPEGAAPLVAPGQRAIGGETVLADLSSAEPARLGEVR